MTVMECPECGQAARWNGTDGSESGTFDVWECPDGHEFTTEAV